MSHLSDQCESITLDSVALTGQPGNLEIPPISVQVGHVLAERLTENCFPISYNTEHGTRLRPPPDSAITSPADSRSHTPSPTCPTFAAQTIFFESTIPPELGFEAGHHPGSFHLSDSHGTLSPVSASKSARVQTVKRRAIAPFATGCRRLSHTPLSKIFFKTRAIRTRDPIRGHTAHLSNLLRV